MSWWLRLAAVPAIGLAATWWLGRGSAMDAYHIDIAATPNLTVTGLTDEALAERNIVRLRLGEAEFATGEIVATDPAVQPERPAFARRVSPGRYPVTVYKAQKRVAMAEIRFALGAPARWQMALIPGQDARRLKDDEVFGYPVDAGLGALMDAAARDAFVRDDAQKQARPDYISSYDDVISEPLKAAGGTEVMLKPLPDGPATLAIFQSGWGDGFYASYWGLDATGSPLLLVTDFRVLENGDGRSPREIAFATALAALTPEQRAATAEAYAALQDDDAETLSRILREGGIGPEAPIESTGDTLTFEAIRLDRPRALEALVRHGAPLALPDFLHLGETRTYPAYARFLKAPRSPELLAVIESWQQAAESASSSGAAGSTARGTDRP